MIAGDLASHFGCTVGLKDSVTAVVFVALGTSVPGECVCVCSVYYIFSVFIDPTLPDSLPTTLTLLFNDYK